MPQNDAPPDFAALWQKYHAARQRSTGSAYAGVSGYWTQQDELEAARALIDALTGDAVLQTLYDECEQACNTTKEVGAAFLKGDMDAYDMLNALESERTCLRRLPEQLTIMGLLHGPEEGGDGE